MPQPCVFCGQQPVKKNREHVMPEWLLKMTGDPKRTLKMPFQASLRPGLSDEMSYDALKFPACEKCNRNFSVLEGQARTIVAKMLNSDGLSADELSVFLDWLDKVRTGLWLGGLYLIGNPTGIRPNFHIRSRTGAKDRMVVIFRSSEGPRGLSFFGTVLPLFWYHPVCFSLSINHIFFLNVSTDFLFARRLGFPYPKNESMTAEGWVSAELTPGLERSILPLLNFNYGSEGTEIFQPMYHHRLMREKGESIEQLYQSEYVRNLSLSQGQGIGKPLLQEGKTLRPYPGNCPDEWLPKKKFNFEELLRVIPITTLRLQADLIDHATATKEQRKTYRRLRNVDLQQIEIYKNAEIIPYSEAISESPSRMIRYQARKLMTP